MALSRKQLIKSEIASSISHGIGLLFSISALIILVVFATMHGSLKHIITFSIFGASLVFMYFSSTMLHALTNKTAKKVFAIFDQISIFFLIVGTYIPFALLVVGGVKGWILFSLVTGISVAGAVFKSIFTEKFKLASTMFYIALGWVVVFFLDKILTNLKPTAILLLFLGGLSYSFGTYFFIKEQKRFYYHMVWHIFVIFGTTFHFFSVLLLV